MRENIWENLTKTTITGFDLKSYRQCLQKWNAAISAMNEECKSLGPKNCLPVIYEQLVLHPEQWMRKILNFLEVPWNDRVLHHEAEINKKDGISLSKVERSSDQVLTTKAKCPRKVLIYIPSRSSNQSIWTRCPSGLVTSLTTSLRTWRASLLCWLTLVSRSSDLVFQFFTSQFRVRSRWKSSELWESRQDRGGKYK